MATEEDKINPMVTFAVLAFQQEGYIAEAVQGALQQTYQPLEIILSDDCSSDGTYDVMKHLASNYTGNASIKTNRMDKNAGLAVHLNRVVSMARGSLIVVAAGDDISEPNRVDHLVARWAQSNYSSGSIFSQFLAIDEDGTPIATGGSESFRTNKSWLKTVDRDRHLFLRCPGCTQAFTPDLFHLFGDLDSGVIQEDICLQLRSSLIGGVGFVEKPLVRYRQTKISLSRSGFRDSATRQSKRAAYLHSLLRVYDNYENDCQLAIDHGLISLDDYHWAVAKKDQYVESMRRELEYLQCDFGNRIRMVFAPAQPISTRARWILYTLFPGLYGWRSQRFQ